MQFGANMLSKTIAAFAIVGLLASATAASAQVGGGNEMPNQAKMKGGMMGKSHMKMHRSMKHQSMRKMHKSM